jgi:hypothetical protein
MRSASTECGILLPSCHSETVRGFAYEDGQIPDQAVGMRRESVEKAG